MTRRDFFPVVAIPAVLPAAARADGKPLISFRIGVTQWMPEKRFDALLDFFARHPGTADELAFFTSTTHPPLPLDEIERRAHRLATLMPRVRKQGMAAGINILSTMGHHEENLPNSLQTPWQRVVGPSGDECRGSFCPAQPELLDYAEKLYKAVAEAGPDFIWIDDDVRLQGHKPVSYACFCQLCVRRFSGKAGRTFTRQTLVEALNGGSLEQRLSLRRQWLESNRQVIGELFRRIERVVHQVKPGLPLGFMTGDRFYEGYDFAGWAKVLAGPGNAPVRWRPGGGFYSDETPLQLLEKAHAMGRQVAALPPEVTVIHSELENFPYQRLRKSERITVVEAGAHMAAGTTGTAFNVINMQPDPLDEYLPLLRSIARSRPFYQRVQTALGRSPALGVWPAWNRDLWAAANPDGDWFRGVRLPLNAPYALAEIGIPICYGQQHATVAALTGTAPLAFSVDELRKIFRGGVLMDVDAWRSLERLGLAELTGIKSAEGIDQDASEVLAPHALNGRFAGWSRDCRQSFYFERVYRLGLNAGAETLARMIDYGERDLGPAMTAFENTLGGRVVVMGYYPWSQFHSLPKTTQMKNVCEWLSRGRMPARVETFAKVAVWRHERAAIVLSLSLDPVEKLSLLLRPSGTRFLWAEILGPEREITGIPEGDSVRVTLDSLVPWSLHLLVERP